MKDSTFWYNVKKLLKQSKFTQKSLSVHLGYGIQTVDKWIARNSIPDAIDTYKIAQALNTTVEFLVAGVPPKIIEVPIDYKQKYETLHKDIREVLERD